MGYALRITDGKICVLEHVANNAEECVITNDERLPHKLWNKATLLTSYIRINFPDWKIQTKYFDFPIPYTT